MIRQVRGPTGSERTVHAIAELSALNLDVLKHTLVAGVLGDKEMATRLEVEREVCRVAGGHDLSAANAGGRAAVLPPP
jgi:hypothetical protein